MARINPSLIEHLKKKLGVSTQRVYQLISAKVNATLLPRDLAAIAVAADNNINISKFASPSDLLAIRSANSGIANQAVTSEGPVQRIEQVSAKRNTKIRKKKPTKRRGTSVFVVHGRNEDIRADFFSFLRSVGLHPIEWRKAIGQTKKASPMISEILDAAFHNAVAIVVLMTPDDQAKLRLEFVKGHDPAFEKKLTGQARPNVLFEAGMALGRNPDSTVLVQIGTLRPFSDIAGRHVVRLTNSPESRQELITKLENAGCNVDVSGTDWLRTGNFQ